MSNKDFKTSRLKYKMFDGTTVEMSLSMILLYRLRAKNKKAYENVSKLLTNGPKEVIEIAEILYGAYLCANLEEEKPTSFESFLENMNPSYEVNGDYVSQLISPKKK